MFFCAIVTEILCPAFYVKWYYHIRYPFILIIQPIVIATASNLL